MNKTLRTSLVIPAVAVAVLGISVWSQSHYTPLEASSHREAPLIADDPLADNTDLYAFRAPNDPSRIVIIADYIPFELPHGGPNYYTFGKDVRYEVHVKNNPNTAGDDITYRFTFQQQNEDPTTFFNIRLNQQNLKTTYTCEKSVGGGAFTAIVTGGVVAPNNIGARSIEGGAGLNAPDYESLRTNSIANATGGGGETIFCGPADDPFYADLGAIFDLANIRKNNATDGLSRKNVHSIALSIPISTLQMSGQDVSQASDILDPNYVIGVWASASRRQISTFDGNGGQNGSGNYVQVSRLGMPLTNEVINPVGAKDRWNSRTPYDEDVVTDDYLSNPEVDLYMDDRLFGGAVPGLADLRVQTNSLGNGVPGAGFDFGNTRPGLFPLKGNPALAGTALDDAAFGNYLLVAGKPRSVDIKPIFHTGVPNLRPYQLATGKPAGNPLAAGKPFINNFLPLLANAGGNPGGDMLRLNMAVPPTPRNSADFSNDGLLAAAALGLLDTRFNQNMNLQAIPNMDGFPNGRRLEDEVAKIELKAASGLVLAAIGLWYDDYTVGGSPVTPDLLSVVGFTTGLEQNDTTLRTSFPYVQTPWRGTGSGGGPTNQTNFADQQDNPEISFLAPAVGPIGSSVVINGKNFNGTTSVTFDGVNAPGFVVNGGGNQITVMVPNGATTGTVVVTTPGGVAPSPLYFTVMNDLIVSTTRTIPTGTYRNITVTGTGNGTLEGNVTVTGTLLVQSGGTFDDGCAVISGSGKFTLMNGGTLRICHPQGISASGATGAIQVTGTRAFASDATYMYDGTTGQITGTGLPLTVTNLGVENATTVSLSQAVSIRQVLRLMDGVLMTNAKVLTLLSNATSTAMVVNAGGVVSGLATAQRYIGTADNVGLGYRHLSSPTQNSEVNDLATTGFAPVVNPAYNTAPDPLLVTPYPNVLGYDETRFPADPDFVKGYFSPATLDAILMPGHGYSVYMRGGLKPDFMGNFTQANVTVSGLTRTGNFLAGDEKSGWHLLGNPFPSPLDWDLVTVPAGMSQSISVYRSTGSATGIYLTRANGIGTLPDGLLPLGQGFFARVTGAGPVSLTLPNSARPTTFENPYYGRPKQDDRAALSLTLRQAGPMVADAQDEAFVYFQAGATAGVDATFDGERPAHNDGVPTLVTLAPKGEELAVNGLPLTTLTSTTTVPLLLDLPNAGTYQLAVGRWANLTGNAVTLVDKLTNTRYELTAQTNVTFTVTKAGNLRNRFQLEFGQRANATAGTAPSISLYPNPAHGAVRVSVDADVKTITLLDATGRTVRTVKATDGTAELSLGELPAGVYTVRAGTANQRLVVE